MKGARVSLFDKLRRWFLAPPVPRARPVPAQMAAPPRPAPAPERPNRTGQSAPSAVAPPRRPQQQPAVSGRPAAGYRIDRDCLWIPPGQLVTIAGQVLPGGLLYVGHGLRSVSAEITEPALIDPSLRVDLRRPDWAGRGLEYWPSYAEIPPASRAAYLVWLAGGRTHPDVPLGYVFLFFYGLERFALVDAAHDPALRIHLPAIAGEVRRLLELYGSQHSFQSYASSFLRVLELLQLSATDLTGAPAPGRDDEDWPPPMALRLGLGQLARDGRPVPADWALAWQWYHPQISRRIPQSRCRVEFDTLFGLRYRQRHGEGVTLRAARSRITVDYYAASAGIRTLTVSTDLPDVFERAGPTRALAELVDEVTGELEAYSRWLGKNPDGRGTLPAAALLPADLVDNAAGEVRALRRWLDEQLAGATSRVVAAEEFLTHWPTMQPGRVTKSEAVSAAALLSRLGVGIEPDVRLGGPVVATGAVVLFRTGPDAPCTASPAYTAAATLLHMAVAVSASDGVVSDDEHRHLIAHVQSALHLTAAERIRLEAHLQWLVATGVKLTGLTKRLAALSDVQRSAIGDFVVTVAAADGVVSPEEIKTLTRIFKLLGMSPDGVHGRIHHHLAGRRPHDTRPAPATEPVTVRPATPGPGGYALPGTSPVPSGPAAPGGTGDGPGSAGTSARQVVLNEAVIAEKLAETAQVSALLADIFADDENATSSAAAQRNGEDGPTAIPNRGDTAPGDPPVADLNSAHSGLIRALAVRPTWTSREYADLAERFGVLPAGALDVLNEAAIEICGEPFAEGSEDSDNIQINDYACQELLQ